jgi:hypothetical protein
MPIYEILVIDTNKFKVQVEAETPEQALERAERLGLTEDSWCEGTIKYCEDAICEIENFRAPLDVREHNEGWEYIA